MRRSVEAVAGGVSAGFASETAAKVPRLAE
jgi:hypothetical protein